MTQAVLAALLAALRLLLGQQEDAVTKTRDLIALVEATPCTDCAPAPAPATAVATLAELKAALADPAVPTIKVTADITFGSTSASILTITRPVTLVGVDMPEGRVQGAVLADGTWEPAIKMPKLRGRLDVKANDVILGPGLEFVPEYYDVIVKGVYPYARLTLDRVVVDGENNGKVKRGVEPNTADFTIKQSAIVGVWKAGQDSQAIGAWNTPGPGRIVDNWVEGASENIMFGGATPVPYDIIATDIEITDNDIYKRRQWYDWRATSAGGTDPRSVNVKNLFELKSARKVRFLRNRLGPSTRLPDVKGSWTDGQTGSAMVISVRASTASSPAMTIEDLVVAQNEIRDATKCFNVLGRDYTFHSAAGKNWTFQDNLCVTPEAFQTICAQTNLVIDHNTFVTIGRTLAKISRGQYINADNTTYTLCDAMTGFQFTNNLAVNGTVPAGSTDKNIYGIWANNGGTATTFNGKGFSTALYVDPVVKGNVLAGVADIVYGGHGYPAGNVFPSVADFYAALTTDTFRLLSTATYPGVTTDGTVPGRR